MDIWNALAGMVQVEITSAEPEVCLAAVSAENTEIWNIEKHGDLTYSFYVPKNRYQSVRTLCKKRGDSFRIRRWIGFYWLLRKMMSRSVLLMGIVLFLVAILWLPTRVLFVQVEGNVRIPARKILAAAEENGVVFGASRRKVRSEQVKNALLSAVPELQWAGVNTSGCTAVISVREKAESEETEKNEAVASLVADRDGYVLSANATAGTLQVKPGDTVRKGQVLISAYTDCGLCIRAERAEGEIFAQTRRDIEVVTPQQRHQKGKAGKQKRKYSLLLRKKRIFLWKDSGIWEGSCGRMYEEYYITLPGGFRLPAAFCVETYCICQISPMDILETDARNTLDFFAEAYLLGNMVAGKIVSEFETLKPESGRYCLTGNYICEEIIGTIRQEQIGDTNGKNS